MPNLTLDQKRLEQLRIQIYGKNTPLKSKAANLNSSSFKFEPNSSHQTEVKNENAKIELSYLKKDLLKIFILSTLVITFQTALFISLKNNVLHIP